VKPNVSMMYDPIELLISLGDLETQAWGEEDRRLEADFGPGALFAAEASARDADSFTPPAAEAVADATIHVRWSRAVSWPKGITFSESR